CFLASSFFKSSFFFATFSFVTPSFAALSANAFMILCISAARSFVVNCAALAFSFTFVVAVSCPRTRPAASVAQMTAGARSLRQRRTESFITRLLSGVGNSSETDSLLSGYGGYRFSRAWEGGQAKKGAAAPGPVANSQEPL